MLIVPCKTHRTIFLILLLFFVGGCVEDTLPIGHPTPLGNKSPMSVICEIQGAFNELSKPVFRKIKYHEPWTESRLAAGTTRFAEYYEIFLTKEAYKFLEKYSPLEISTALSPLIIEEENGADALAIQYAMSFHGKRRNLDPIFPRFIFEKYHNLPLPKEYLAQYPPMYAERLRAEMKWDKEQRLQWGGGYRFIRGPHEKEVIPNTLEQKIVGILDDVTAVKPRWNNPDWYDSPDLDIKIINFESVRSATPVYPTIGEKFQEFSRSHDPELIATVLLSKSDVMTLGIYLGTYKKYWPVYTKNWPRDVIPGKQAYEYELEMQDEVVTTVHGYCK